MSFGRSAPALDLRLNASGQLALLLVLAHTVAALCVGWVWSAAGTLPAVAALGAVLASLLITVLRHVFHLGRRAIRAALWTEAGDWWLITGDRREVAATLLPDSYLHPAVVILGFDAGERRPYYLVVPADALDPETHRRLRVRLRTISVDHED